MSITIRAASISPSLTLEITAKAKKMKAEGISVIGFGAGEPDFNTPDYITEAAKKAIDNGFTKYTPSSGMPELRKAICEKLKRENNLIYEPSQIIVSNGAKHSLYNALQTIIQEGDEVIIPAPYWLTYPELVKVCGGVCKYIYAQEKDGFKITPDNLKAAINSKTKAVIINSPSNPTGAVYCEKELYALAEVLQESGVYVIADEIYEKLVYGGAKHISIATYSEKLKEKTIVLNGMSKAYAMTGWRIGYLAAAKEIAKAVDSLQSHQTSNACSISQAAALTALSGGEDFIAKMVSIFDERRKFMIKRIKEIKGLSCTEPKGAFYVMVDVSNYYGKKFADKTINNSIEFAECALQKGVALVPGIAFGADKCVRLSYAISLEDIAEGLNRLESFISEVK